MREIKFRVWVSGESGLTKTGYSYFSYFTLAQLQFGHGIPVLMTSGEILSQCVGCSEETGEFEYHFHIEQYTGLHDKNGLEIYEGDVVATLTGENEEVEYEDGGFWPFCIAGSECQDAPEDCIVIGNIHENPELLEASRA